MTGARLGICESLVQLPPSAGQLLDSVGDEDLFVSRPWFESFISAGLSPGAEPLFLTLAGEDGIAGMIACQRKAGDPALSGLTSFYSCDFRPLIAAGAGAARVSFDLGREFIAHFSGEAVIGFDSLDSSDAALEPFLAGLARPGRILLRYAHFGRWWEDIEARSFAEYLGARDGALREVIRRKGAKLERGGGTFNLLGAAHDEDAIEQGIADYEAVYAASWKEREPFPSFQPTLMRKLAKAGWLRLALCHLGGKPIAAQLWVVCGRKATVLKLAHDRQFDKQSPGTLLTAFAIRALMEQDRIATIDFGRGDDPYKKAWTTNRTTHIGVLSVDLKRRPLLVARHLAGAALRRLRSRAG